MKTAVFFCLTIGMLGTTGCVSHTKRKAVEAVARDWCQVVRASQVIPVYPLTEDVQPGDVFLVTTPIGQEAAQYARRGFLPLDQHLGRLHELDFAGFYQKSFGVGDHSDTPHHWQFPEKPSPGQPPGSPAESATAGHRIRTGWIENARLYEKIEQSYLSMIVALSGVVEARDLYTDKHMKDIAEYSVEIARQ